MDSYSISDFPKDIDPNKKYWVQGQTLIGIGHILGELWEGKNIRIEGGTIVPAGDGGYSIFIKKTLLGSAPTHPLQVIPASADGTPEVKVVWGTYNGIVPNIDGATLTVDLNDPSCPVMTLGGSDKIIYAELDLNDDGVTINSVSLSSSSSATPPDSDQHTAYQTIAGISIDDNGNVTVSDNVSGSQNFTRCQVPFSDPPAFTDQFTLV